MQRAGVRVADDCDARTAQKINHLVKHRLRIEGHRTTMMGECVALPAHITPECAANGRTDDAQSFSQCAVPVYLCFAKQDVVMVCVTAAFGTNAKC
jgi:hypothetical protein